MLSEGSDVEGRTGFTLRHLPLPGFMSERLREKRNGE